MAVMCNSESIKWPLCNLYLQVGTIKWSSMAFVPRDWNCPLLFVESVTRDGNYKMIVCEISA